MFSLKKSIYRTRRDPSCECVGGEVVIGNQIWTCSNLDVTTFRNGEVIPQITDPTAWLNSTTPAWCYYDNDPANGAIYGKLYNWHAVRDPRGLAPNGYHIPTDAEWTTLTDYLGGLNVAGGKMKKVSTLWTSPNTDATNSSCFTGLPGGVRSHTGSYNYINSNGFWWSSTEYNVGDAWFRAMYNNSGIVGRDHDDKGSGVSVRLVKEDVPLEPFDYIIVTYEYTPPINPNGNGIDRLDYDLDTITTLRYATGTLTGNSASTIAGFIPGTGTVGCATGASGADSTRPSGVPLNSAYLRFGGDDAGQQLGNVFGESVVVNFKNLKDASITTSNDIVVELYAGWNSQQGGYTPFPINIKYETFIGGTVSREVVGLITTNRYVSTGTSVSSPQVSPPKTITTGTCSTGIDVSTGPSGYKQHVASINYNLVTKISSVIFH